MKDEKSLKSRQFRCEPLSDDELYTFVSKSLIHNNVKVLVDRIHRRVTKHRNDWRGNRLFEKIAVLLTNGNSLTMFLKYHYSDSEPDLKMAPLQREANVYESLLKDPQFGTAHFYGLCKLNNDRKQLLLIEFVRGRRLKRFNKEKVWLEVAKWLAHMHHHFFHRQDELYAVTSLHRYDSGFYWNLAYQAAASASKISAKASVIMDRILADYDKIANPLNKKLLTLLHGEFYCTNILVSHKNHEFRICPFDWETAGIGCAALDLTYLFRQRLGIRRSNLIKAYLEGWQDMGSLPLSPTELWQYIYRSRVHELMYFIWSSVNQQHISAEKIIGYAERAERFMESLD